jgi:hypothetical protein
MIYNVVAVVTTAFEFWRNGTSKENHGAFRSDSHTGLGE